MSDRRDPVDRVLDAIVAVPVSLAVATRRLVPIATTRLERRVARDLKMLSRYGRRRTGSPTVWEVADEDDELPADWVPDTSATITSVEAAAASHDTHGEPVAVASLPIAEYDHLSARQIVDRLGALEPGELAIIAAYEGAHRRRQTVLHRIAQLA